MTNCHYFANTFATGVEHKIEETLHNIPINIYKHKNYISQRRNDRKSAESLCARPKAPEDAGIDRGDHSQRNAGFKESTFSANSDTPSQRQMTNKRPLQGRYNAAEKLSSCPSALDDFKALCDDPFLTDVVLKTATKSFPVHKNVLYARSAVFRAMLKNDMKETNTDCIRVDDLDDETVQRFLLFLYSDNIEELEWESALKLYYAADKYAIEKLKVLCSSYMIGNLDASTASELLLLADTHSDEDLKQFVEDFILEHDEEVFVSDNWDKLSETHPHLVINTMKLKYKKKGESALKLYYAADTSKYAIEKLKVLCSSYMTGNLNASTASELLLLADTHSDEDLKQFVEDFILEHEEEVFDSDNWDKLSETHPDLVIKTMKLKYKKKKGGKEKLTETNSQLIIKTMHAKTKIERRGK